MSALNALVVVPTGHEVGVIADSNGTIGRQSGTQRALQRVFGDATRDYVPLIAVEESLQLNGVVGPVGLGNAMQCLSCALRALVGRG